MKAPSDPADKSAELAPIPRPNGRPPIYSRELADRVLAAIEAGRSMRDIAEDPNLVHFATICRWVTDDVDGFSERYARSREVSFRMMGEEIIRISDERATDIRYITDSKGKTKEVTYDNVERSRLRVDARKWLLAKMMPKVYGDHVGAQPVVQIDQNVDSLGLIREIAAVLSLAPNALQLPDESAPK